MRGQPQGDDREDYEDRQSNQIGDDKRQHAFEDRGEIDVLNDAFYHKNDHADRRMDEAKFHSHHDDDAEPDRVEAEVCDDREDDGHRQDHHRERVHQAAEHQVHHHDQREHAVAAD